MKKYLIALVLTFFLCMPAFAEDAEPNDEEIETNAFGYPEKNLVAVIEGKKINKDITVNPKPDCNDPKLAAQAQEALKPLIEKDAPNIAERRQIKLILKNIDRFSALPKNEISPQKHRQIAGRLVELKINNHLDDENITVCQTDNPILSAKLYLVLYDQGNHVAVEIINFSRRNIPSFIFKKD